MLHHGDPLPVETRVTAPPLQFSVGEPTMTLAHQNLTSLYNNNIVNNEVSKKLTTKLASMKYYGNLV